MKMLFQVFLMSIGVIVAGLMILAALNVLSAYQHLGEIQESQQYMGCFESGRPTQDEIERDAWIKLPPSARNLVPYSEDMCNTFYLRFEMLPADLITFRAGTLIKQGFAKNKQPLDFGRLPADLGWNLKGVNSYLGGVYEVPGALRQSVIIDMNDARLYVVYVIMADLTT